MRQWQRAMEVIEALLAGRTRPRPPTAAGPATPPPVTAASAVADSAAALFGLAAPSPSKVESATTSTPSLALPFSDAAFRETGSSRSQYSPADGSLDEGLFAAAGGGGIVPAPLWRPAGTEGGARGAATSKPPFADELDWTLPLRQGTTPPSGSVGPPPRRVGVTAGAAPAPSPLVRAGMDLGLQLLEGCVAAGMGSVAKHVVRMLMSQVGGGGACLGA